MPVREHFEKDLKALQNKLVELCKLPRALERSLQAFEQQNMLLAQEIIDGDHVPDLLLRKLWMMLFGSLPNNNL